MPLPPIYTNRFGYENSNISLPSFSELTSMLNLPRYTLPKPRIQICSHLRPRTQATTGAIDGTANSKPISAYIFMERQPQTTPKIPIVSGSSVSPGTATPYYGALPYDVSRRKLSIASLDNGIRPVNSLSPTISITPVSSYGSVPPKLASVALDNSGVPEPSFAPPSMPRINGVCSHRYKIKVTPERETSSMRARCDNSGADKLHSLSAVASALVEEECMVKTENSYPLSPDSIHNSVLKSRNNSIDSLISGAIPKFEKEARNNCDSAAQGLPAKASYIVSATDDVKEVPSVTLTSSATSNDVTVESQLITAERDAIILAGSQRRESQRSSGSSGSHGSALSQDSSEPKFNTIGSSIRRRKSKPGKVSKSGKNRNVFGYCLQCGKVDTPEWRNGPQGKATLCNACGLFYKKLKKYFADENMAIQFMQHRSIVDPEDRTMPKF